MSSRDNDNIVYYVLPIIVTDENDVPESAEVLSRLEKIDEDANSMDITFVKMADTRYARKWGVTKLPAIVYFRNKFPSVYRGKKNV